MPPATVEAAAPPPMSTEELKATLRELQAQVPELEEAHGDAAKRRHFSQCECDATRGLLQAARRGTERIEEVMRSTDLRRQELEKGHLLELQVYEHKVSHLTYQHQMLLVRIEENGELGEEDEHAEHASRAAAVRGTIRGLGKRRVAMESEQETEVRRIEEQFEKLYRRREKDLFEDRLTDLRRRLDERMAVFRERAVFRTKVDASELTERKNEHIRTLAANHERAFGQMKEYYSAIARDNVAIIGEYRASLEQIKRRIGSVREEAEAVAAENTGLRVPLAETLAHQRQLADALALWDKDRASLAFAHQRLRKSRRHCDQLTRLRDELREKLRRTREDVDVLKEAFERGVLEIRQRNAMIGEGLEHDARLLEAEIDTVHEAVTQTAARADLDPAVLSFTESATGQAFQAQSDELVILRQQLMSASHNLEKSRRVMRAKLLKMGVSVAELEAMGLHDAEESAPPRI